MDTVKLSISKYELQHKIPPGDPFWPKFNAGFVNTEADTTEIMDAIYSGRAITTQHKDNWRTSANYLLGQHLALDFDSEDEQSTIQVLEKDKFICKYASFIHTTISHKPEAPRARVIFTLDAPIMQAKNYALAAQSLLWLFGAADRQCKDPVRFFYGSPNCDFEFLGNTLPLDTVKKLIASYQDTGTHEKRKSERNYTVPASQQEVADALRLIPAWGIEYDEWVQVLMGIHSAFGSDGLSLAETWADGRPKEVQDKWRSFHDTGNGSGAVTVATVFGIAKRYGWTKAVIL